LDKQFGAFGVGMGWQAVSSRYNDAANDYAVAGYGVLGLRGSWQMDKTLSWQVKVDNLLGKDYTQALYTRPNDPGYLDVSRYGYREEGRSAQLALTWTPSL
jgi:vitamin B12 transporter